MGCGPSASKKYAGPDNTKNTKSTKENTKENTKEKSTNKNTCSLPPNGLISCSESKRADRQIVLAAAKKDGSALMFF